MVSPGTLLETGLALAPIRAAAQAAP
jgi:hypothetical protein